MTQAEMAAAILGLQDRLSEAERQVSELREELSFCKQDVKYHDDKLWRLENRVDRHDTEA